MTKCFSCFVSEVAENQLCAKIKYDISRVGSATISDIIFAFILKIIRLYSSVSEVFECQEHVTDIVIELLSEDVGYDLE